jgi:acetyl-CoA carboxylase/biotin carboxylase 1
MSMLVEAPAAVEDALASLLDHTDPLVQRRALATYVRRIYHPFLLHSPQLTPAPAEPRGGGGGAGHHPPRPLMAVWAYDDPATAATPLSRECHGGALLLRCLHDLPAALAQLVEARERMGVWWGGAG